MFVFLRLFFELIEIDGVFFGKWLDVVFGKARIHPPTDALRKPSALEKKFQPQPTEMRVVQKPQPTMPGDAFGFKGLAVTVEVADINMLHRCRFTFKRREKRRNVLRMPLHSRTQRFFEMSCKARERKPHQ